jgi:hypothetical protein
MRWRPGLWNRILADDRHHRALWPESQARDRPSKCVEARQIDRKVRKWTSVVNRDRAKGAISIVE